MKVTERPSVKNVLTQSSKDNKICPTCNDETGKLLFCSDQCRWISEHCTRLDDHLHSTYFDDYRWIIIGINSSTNAMREIAGLQLKGFSDMYFF